jgi:hypothetical protein
MNGENKWQPYKYPGNTGKWCLDSLLPGSLLIEAVPKLPSTS